MTVDGLSDDEVRGILTSLKTFAVVGASQNPARPSYGVMRFLLDCGYTVKPINPGISGKTIHGQPVFASLADVPGPAEVVDIFRASDAVPGVVQDAIAQKDRLATRVIWMQLGIVTEQAATQARTAGLTVVMDRCPKIEYARLMRG